MNIYKQKSVTLKIPTHNKLHDLSKTIVPGAQISVPATIDLLVNEKVSTSKSPTANEGATNETQKTLKT